MPGSHIIAGGTPHTTSSVSLLMTEEIGFNIVILDLLLTVYKVRDCDRPVDATHEHDTRS